MHDNDWVSYETSNFGKRGLSKIWPKDVIIAYFFNFAKRRLSKILPKEVYDRAQFRVFSLDLKILGGSYLSGVSARHEVNPSKRP